MIALGGAEVAAVDAGEQQAGEQERAAVGVGVAAVALAAALDGLASRGWRIDQDQRERDQYGDDRLEGPGRQRQQQYGPPMPPISAATPSRRTRRRWPAVRRGSRWRR